MEERGALVREGEDLLGKGGVTWNTLRDPWACAGKNWLRATASFSSSLHSQGNVSSYFSAWLLS